MEVFLTALHIVLCFFLLLVVLLQPGKGADFGAAMGGASQEVLGAAGSVSLLAKVTTIVAAMFMGTSLSLAYLSNAPESSFISGDELEQELKEVRGEDGADAGGSSAPDAEEAPATEEAPAAEGAEAPAEDAEAPAEGAEAPAEDAEAPAEGAEAPAEEAEAPAAEEPAEAPADEAPAPE